MHTCTRYVTRGPGLHPQEPTHPKQLCKMDVNNHPIQINSVKVANVVDSSMRICVNAGHHGYQERGAEYFAGKIQTPTMKQPSKATPPVDFDGTWK